MVEQDTHWRCQDDAERLGVRKGPLGWGNLDSRLSAQQMPFKQGYLPSLPLRVMWGLWLSHVILSLWSCLQAMCALSGSPKALSTCFRKMSNVCIWVILFMTAMVSFTAQTSAVPLHMKESAYKIFILSSVKVSACMVIAVWMACKNSLVLSQLLLKGLGSAALALQIRLCEVWTGMLVWGFVTITCVTAECWKHNSCMYADVTWFGGHVMHTHNEQNARGP